MESPEFNLSVLENVTTFSTPLKDCSDYDAILSLIKEEIDISQTEDEVDYSSRLNNASRSRARRPDSESRDYNSKFKPPYGINHSAETKSPGTALLSRKKRRSHNDLKNDTSNHATQRARTLGRIMPGRSVKSTCRQHRFSGCYSDTSWFSDPAENGKTLNRKSLTPRKKFDYYATDAYETEGEALTELLSMAQEQVIVNGSPYGRNSTVSSQGESTSLATSDPLDTGAMEEECYVESSQAICVSDFRKKLLNHRSICDMPKNVEMIKRNLHFSDPLESEEDNQNFSLALSPESTSVLNYDIDWNSIPAADRKRKESQDSIASIVNSPTPSSCNFYSHREPSTTPPHSRMGKSSRDSIAQAFNSSTLNSFNSQNQREASTTSQLSSMSKTSRESTPGIQNSTYDLHDLEREREASTTPQPCTRKPSRESTPSTTSTLNVIHDLEELELKREASMTPETYTRKTRQGSMTSTNSTASTLNLPYDLQDLEPKREATTPQHSNTSEVSQDSTASILKNLPQDLQDLDPEKDASTGLEPSSMRKTSQDITPNVLKDLTQDLPDLDTEKEASTTLEPSSMRKTSQDSTASVLKNLTQDLPDLDTEKEASTTLEPSSMRKTSQDSTASVLKNLTQDLPDLGPERETSTPDSVDTASILRNLIQDLHDLDPEGEASTRLEPSSTRKTSQDSTSSTSENLAQDLPNFNPEKEASATLPQPRKRKTRRHSRDTLLKNLTQEFDLNNVDSAKEASVTPLHSRERKTSQGSTASSRPNLNREMQNLVPEREADAPPLQPGKSTKTSQDSIDRLPKSLTPNSCNSHDQREASPTAQLSSIRKTSQHSTANLQESVTQDLQNLDPKSQAIAIARHSRHRKTNQGSMTNSQESLTQELENLNLKRDASATPPHPRHRKTSQNSVASSQNSFTPDLSNFYSPQEARQVTPPRPRKRKTSQASTESSAKSPTRDLSDVDSAKEVSVMRPRPKHWKITQDTTANSQESLTEDLQNSDFKKEASATPPYPRHRTASQNSIGSSQKSFTEELSRVDSAPDAKVTLPNPRKRKTSQASTVSPLKSPTRDPSNVDSAKEASVTPPRPKKKRKKKSDIAPSLEGLTRDTSNVDPAKEANLPPPRSTKRKKNKTKIASPPNNVTQDPTDLVLKRESLRPRKRKSSVVSPLKGLTQELENCIMNVDFERLCEEIDNDAESPSFTFETVQLLDDYNDCNPEANNKILSKILASPSSKTDSEAPRSVEHIGSNEDLHDYDPLYIAEAEDNEIGTLSTSKRKEKTGTKNAGNKTKSLMVDKSVKESKGRIDKDDTLEQGTRRPSRSRKKRVTMTMSDTEQEVDLSDTVNQVPKKVKTSSEDPLDDDAPYIADAEDNETATPSTSKRKEKKGTKKKGKKRKRVEVDKSFNKESKRIIDNDGTLEERTRRSSRSRKTQVTMTISDWEDEGDLSDEAAKVTKKVNAAKKKERLSLETLTKLAKIVVQLRHEVLPQHDIEPRAGTTSLTYEQQTRFLDFASLNKDLYSTEEDEIIKRNWNAFCEDHDWDPQNYRVFLKFKHGDQLIMSCFEERRKFVQFLADGLPNRPLFSVYSRFKKIYSEYADAGECYSLEEDKKILAHMLRNREKKPHSKFAELSKVLKRPPDSIWKRYRNLKAKEIWNEKSKKVMMKVEWHLSLVTEFITKLLDVTISDDLMELKDAFIPIVVWRKLEEKIEIDHNFMKRSWEHQFHLQFFSPEPISANTTKIRLIEYMWMKGIRDGREIEWHVVLKYFDGCTISFLRTMFNHLTSEASIVLKSRNLSDIMKWLYEIKIGRLRRCPNDHYLPRLRYVDKRVEIVHEDTTKVTLILKGDSLY